MGIFGLKWFFCWNACVLILLLWVICFSSVEDVTTVDVHCAKGLIGSGHRFLDVRTAEEFKKRHLENSLNVPFMFSTPQGRVRNPEFVEQVSVICNKEDEILVGCQSGVRSLQASADLLNAGFKDVKNVGGGIAAWLENGFPVKKPEDKVSGLEIGGEMNLTAGIQVAQLALKHRQNKNQQQRIIVFAGSSPVKYEKKSLEAIGRKLKKNSVSLDVVDFGEAEDGKSEKLEALVAAVNNNGSSHIVHVPSGPNALSDVLISTPIFTGDGDGGSGFAAAAAAAAAGGISGYDFGVDPNIDPELALALRVSMEEERARQEAAAKRAAEDAAKQEKGGEPVSSSHDVTMAEPVSSSALAADEKRHDLTDDESALLEQALAMSMDDAMSGGGAIADADMSDATTTDDQELAMALQMSVQESAKDPSAQSDLSKVLEDQSFVSSILNSLPGVDPNDPSVKDLLASLQGQSEQKKSEDNQENKGDK